MERQERAAAGHGLCFHPLPVVAQLLGISQRGVERLIATGELRPRRITPGRVGVRSDELDAWIMAREVARSDENDWFVDSCELALATGIPSPKGV